MENRAGYFKSNLSGEMAYQSFVPAPLPPAPPVDLGNEGLTLLIQANRQLALLEGLATRIPNMDLFVSMYVRKEALLSSQIEGTQATLDDVLDPLLDENANRNVADVINYIKASEFAIKRLQELPLCNRLIKETHAVLMEGVRGQEKNPGEFRYSQNWIGGQGSTLKNARYIPPNPEDMNEAISDLEKYMNSEDGLDPLVRAALIHYQFETIHPFLDGNGRVGRLLIMRLMIVAQGVRDSVQSAIVDVATENWDEAYAGLREGYSGGYQLAGSSWSQNVTSGNVYARLQDVLGIEYEGGQYVKYSGENLEYRLYDLHLDVENAPLAPSVPDGITQLNVTGTITVDVPLSFGFGHLPPMQITMKLNAKYVPRF